MSKAIIDALKEDGWELEYTLLHKGDLFKMTEWQVTITRNEVSYKTTFSKGSGHRTWKKRQAVRDQGYLSSIKWRDAFNAGTQGEKAELGAFYNVTDSATIDDPERKQQQQHFCEQINYYTDSIPPSLDEVVHGFLSDSSSVMSGETFDDWASDFEYDTDSREAERIYVACGEAWKGLIRLDANFEMLGELFQDY